MRLDLSHIQRWIAPDSRVLDLGCGDGVFLQFLREQRQVQGTGLEIAQDYITAAISRGINVVEQNMDEGLANFPDQSFDTVVLALALQAVNYPDRVLEEMLRIGREGIVTFPNFGHWRCRLHLAMKGRMPVSEHLPHSWFDTPNIHLCTFLDFERFCHDRRLDIIERFVVDAGHANRPLINRFPNFFGTIAFYRLGRPGS